MISYLLIARAVKGLVKCVVHTNRFRPAPSTAGPEQISKITIDLSPFFVEVIKKTIGLVIRLVCVDCE